MKSVKYDQKLLMLIMIGLYFILTVYYKLNKSNGICNNTNDPYAKNCVPNIFKNINLKVFNLMSRKNYTRYIKLHETCKR